MKTITMRVDDHIYETIKTVANEQRRNISNFIEHATLQYLSSSQYINDNEMNETLEDEELLKELEKGFDDVKNGDYTFV